MPVKRAPVTPAAPPPRGGCTPGSRPRIRIATSSNASFVAVHRAIRGLGLDTVCEAARCPNAAECWSARTATFMLLGAACTRACRFCHVETSARPRPPDPSEPDRVARAVAELGLAHAVLTSVDRDDLADGGAAHFGETIRRVKSLPDVRVEALTPDFRGDRNALRTVAEAGPDVFGNNLETVRRLTPSVRDRRAGYEQTLAVLAAVKDGFPRIVTKSSLLLGLGERDDEVEQAMRDLRGVGVDVLTLGQYLRPTAWHVPVAEYLPAARFASFQAMGEQLGFRLVASGPLVRSSYRAADLFNRAERGTRRQCAGGARSSLVTSAEREGPT